MSDIYPMAPYPNVDEEKDMRAEDDARILLLAEEIHKDPERRKAAANALKQIAEKRANEAEDAKDLAMSVFDYKGM